MCGTAVFKLLPKKSMDSNSLSQIASRCPGHISRGSGRCATNGDKTFGYRGEKSDYIWQRFCLGGAWAQPRSNGGEYIGQTAITSHFSNQIRSSALKGGRMAKGKSSHARTIRTYRFAKRWGPSRVRDVSSFHHVSLAASTECFLGIPVLSRERSRPSRRRLELGFRYYVRS